MPIHKMDNLLVCDVVITLNDATKRRLGIIVNFNPKIKPKGCGSTLLNFNITDYVDKEEFKDDLNAVYDKVLGKGFTMWLVSKLNMILHNSQYKDSFVNISLLNVKEIDKFNESIIADFPINEEVKETELKGE